MRRFPFFAGARARIRLTIGMRLSLGFLLTLLVFVLQTAITNYALNLTTQSFHDYEQLGDEASQILHFKQKITELRQTTLVFTYSGYEGLIGHIHALERDIGQELSSTLVTVTDPERHNLLERIHDHFPLFTGNFQSAIDERRERDRLSNNQLATDVQKVVNEIEDLRTKLPSLNTNAVMSLNQIEVSILEAHNDTLRFLATPDSTFSLAARQKIVRADKVLAQLITDLPKGELHSQAERIRTDFQTVKHDLIGVIQTTRGYLYGVYVVMAGEAEEINILVGRLNDLTLSRQREVRARIEATILEGDRVSFAVSVLAGLVMLFLSVWMTRSLAGPLQAITASFRALTSGHLDQPIPGRDRHDEIGALAGAAEVFKDKARQLENASLYKTEFLANMSHELRTPLNSMIILSKIFAENATGNLSTEQTESASIVYESGTSLLAIINDILELSKIEAGHIDIYHETKTFRRFAGQFSRQFRHVAAQKGIEFYVKLDPALPEAMHTDWGKIAQVVRNLVGNAIKFTEKGSVHLWIGHSPPGPAADAALPTGPEEWLVFQVQDTGIGIDADKHDQIFEAFRQADGSTSRKYGGTGLGLAISRRYAALLGGRLTVESTLGMGSTFRFFLPMNPLQIADPKQDIGDSSNNDNTSYFDSYFSTRNIKCLVVDDDANNLYAIRRILGHRMHRLWTASDGQQALHVLEENPDIHLVLLDIMMPVLNGYETMRAIRAQPRFDALRIIALTARALPEDRERCLNYGANHYLAKPVIPARLLSTIIVCLGDFAQVAIAATPSIADPRSLQVDPPNVPSNTSDRMPLLDSTGVPINLLIIDPDMRALYSLAQTMKPWVRRCLLAAHGKKAMELLNQCEIGAIVLDPQAASVEAGGCLAALRSNPRTSHLPIIVLSATNTPEEMQPYWQAGASECIAKSAPFSALVEALRAALVAPRPRG